MGMRYMVVIKPTPGKRQDGPVVYSNYSVERDTTVNFIEADSPDDAAEKANPDPNTTTYVVEDDHVSTFKTPDRPKPVRHW